MHKNISPKPESLEEMVARLQGVEKEVDARASNHTEASAIYQSHGVDRTTADILAGYSFERP